MKKNNNLRERLLEVWDVAFVLLLCFVVLLLTMIFNGMRERGEIGAYIIEPGSFVAVAVAIFGYLWYMIKNSLKQLRSIYDNAAQKKEGDNK